MNISKDISITLPTLGNVEALEHCANGLTSTCSCPEKVEILFKVDTPKAKSTVESIFKDTPFDFRILHNSMSGFANSSKWTDDLCRMADSNLFMTYGDDILMTGDWYTEFVKTRSLFEDQIYAICTRNHYWCYTPVITREWFQVLGTICPVLAIDTWVRDLARKLGRYVRVDPSVDSINCSYKFGSHSHNPLLRRDVCRELMLLFPDPKYRVRTLWKPELQTENPELQKGQNAYSDDKR